MNNNVDDFIETWPNTSTAANISINLQCGKSLPEFASVAWSNDECTLVFDDAVQFNNDSFLYMGYNGSNVTLATDTTLSFRDLLFYFDSNYNPNITSSGSLFQTIRNGMNVNDTTPNISMSFVMHNVMMEGSFNGPAIYINAYFSVVSITECEFYDMPHGVISAEDIDDLVYLQDIIISNVSKTDYSSDDVIAIYGNKNSSHVIMNNLDVAHCIGTWGCIAVSHAYSLSMDNYKCTQCVGLSAALDAYDIQRVTLSNVTMTRNHGFHEVYGDGFSAGITVWYCGIVEIINALIAYNVAGAYSAMLLADNDGAYNYLSNITFIDNELEALSFMDQYVNYTWIDNCVFTNNSESASAAALSVTTSSVTGAYYVTNTLFSHNKAGKFAGAIINEYNDLFIDNCDFIQNEADIGGAIAYSQWFEPNPLTITNTRFLNNVAYSSGGAIYVFSGEYVLHNVQCNENQAKISGGCIHDANGFLDCHDANLVRSVLQSTTFYGNKARQAAAGYLTSCYLAMSDCDIRNNTAYIQGGGFVIDSTAMESDSLFDGLNQYELSNNVFDGNYGGLSGGGLILMGGDINIDGDTVFNNNRAGSKGGGILIQGIDEWNINTNINNAQFSENTAGNQGGAILLETIQLSSSTSSNGDDDDYSANLIMTQCDLDENEGTDGGAIYIANGNMETDECVMTGNRASNGGAVYFDDGRFIDNNSTFEENEATLRGGAIYVNDDNVAFHHSALISNDAAVSGGALYFADYDDFDDYNSSQVCVLTADLSTNMFIMNNTAGLSGGGYFFELSDDFKRSFQDESCEVTSTVCQWCEDCQEESNSAGFGAASATEAYRMNVNWNIGANDVINRISHIQADVNITDFECQLVSKFESEVTLSASIQTEDDERYTLVLDGESLETFVNGEASLSFKIVAADTNADFIQYDETFTLSITLTSSLQQESTSSNTTDALFTQTITVQYENQLYVLPTYVYVLGALLGVLSLIVTIITAYFIKHYGSEKIITGSNVYFLFIILVGIGLASISMIFIPLVPFDVDCRVLLWFVHLAFVFTVMPLAGKTWRIWLFFYYYQPQQLAGSPRSSTGNRESRTQSASQKEFKWTTTRLALVFVVLPLGIVFVYLLIWSFVPDWSLIYLYPLNDNDIAVIKSCPFHPEFYTISYIVCGLSIIILVRLAISVRKVPKNFNESFWLGATIYTICILILFMIPISVVNTIDTATRRTFSIIASFVVIQTTLMFLYWVKFATIKFCRIYIFDVFCVSKQNTNVDMWLLLCVFRGWFKSTKFAFMQQSVASRTSAYSTKDRRVTRNTAGGSTLGRTGSRMGSSAGGEKSDNRSHNSDNDKSGNRTPRSAEATAAKNKILSNLRNRNKTDTPGGE